MDVTNIAAAFLDHGLETTEVPQLRRSGPVNRQAFVVNRVRDSANFVFEDSDSVKGHRVIGSAGGTANPTTILLTSTQK